MFQIQREKKKQKTNKTHTHTADDILLLLSDLCEVQEERNLGIFLFFFLLRMNYRNVLLLLTREIWIASVVSTPNNAQPSLSFVFFFVFKNRRKSDGTLNVLSILVVVVSFFILSIWPFGTFDSLCHTKSNCVREQINGLIVCRV